MSRSFEERAATHGGEQYQHQRNETGWVTGPYAGHDPRNAGFDPAPHPFNNGYNHVPEANLEMRRPFCGMTQSRTQKVKSSP